MLSTDPTDFVDLVDGNLQLILADRSLTTSGKEWVPTYRFSITVDQQEVGLIDLRIGETEFFVRFAGQVGYTIDPPYRGHRYAARALRLLCPLARAHGFHTLWITCNPDNLASRRTCELAGAEFVEVVDLPLDCEMYADGERKKCRYSLAV